MKIFLLLFMAMYSISAYCDLEVSCDSSSMHGKIIFSLEMQPAFAQSVSYAVCEAFEERLPYMVITEEKLEAKSKVTLRMLSAYEYSSLIHLYESSLIFDLKDKDSGLNLDGLYVCLNAYRGRLNFNACFHNPSKNASQRGLLGLLDLAKKLKEYVPNA